MNTPARDLAQQLSTLEQQIASLKEQLQFTRKNTVMTGMDTDILGIVQETPGLSTHSVCKSLISLNDYHVATASGLRKYVISVLESMVKDGLLVNLKDQYPGLHDDAWAPAPAADER